MNGKLLPIIFVEYKPAEEEQEQSESGLATGEIHQILEGAKVEKEIYMKYNGENTLVLNDHKDALENLCSECRQGMDEEFQIGEVCILCYEKSDHPYACNDCNFEFTSKIVPIQCPQCKSEEIFSLDENPIACNEIESFICKKQASEKKRAEAEKVLRERLEIGNALHYQSTHRNE